MLIAKQGSDLLHPNYSCIDFKELREKYLALLANIGMLTAKGSIRFRELIPHFVHLHGRNLLEKLECLFDNNNQDTWLHKMLRKPRHATHPIRHILIQMYLNVGVANICKGRKMGVPDPFGKGPWPCLNKAVDHYREQIIDNVVITRCTDTRKPVATFSCSCEFIYSRRGPDLNATDKFRIGRIKHFGSPWMNRLKELNKDDSLSLREKGRLLGVDPGTIRNQPQKLETFGVITLDKDSTSTPSTTIEQPIHSRKRRRDSNKHKPKRVNWSERDKFLAQEVDRIAEDIKNRGYRFISLSEIGRLLNRSTMIGTKIGKLPITSARLMQVTEYRPL
ncbi:TnsD family Tn7-like transposition protein [Paenibacillus glucanolyticus]|uniref:TnsD family Tn7-like transposition protein n=1 Tax=Paenibacillus glucanolyticus TaxID=59843 RepID=UPI0030ED2DF8